MFPTNFSTRGLGRSASCRRAVAVGLAAAALGSSVAIADTTWTYVVNFGRAHVINESNQTGNFQIWGLGYARLIIGSQGSNVIVGDGACPAGSTATDYCSVAPLKHSKSSIIYANGTGPNTIYAGRGPSVVFGGTGPNAITSSPTSTLIIGGDAGDTINANQGSNVIYAGTGTNTIYALTPDGDTIFCSGQHDTVYAYSIDHIHNCATVIYEPGPGTAGAVAHTGGHLRAPSLRHDSVARRLYARFRAAERRARR